MIESWEEEKNHFQLCNQIIDCHKISNKNIKHNLGECVTMKNIPDLGQLCSSVYQYPDDPG